MQSIAAAVAWNGHAAKSELAGNAVQISGGREIRWLLTHLAVRLELDLYLLHSPAKSCELILWCCTQACIKGGACKKFSIYAKREILIYIKGAIMAAAGGGSGANPKADDAFSKFMSEVVCFFHHQNIH